MATTIDHLRVTAPGPINIIYVCSNQDLAKQNLRRLNVTGEQETEVATRLSMLVQNPVLVDPDRSVTAVNLLSLTPGTSFHNRGHRQGKAEERAIIAHLIERSERLDSRSRRAGRDVLQGMVWYRESFDQLIDQVEQKPLDLAIVERFEQDIRESGALDRFCELRREYAADPRGNDQRWHRAQESIAELRRTLATAGASMLRPHLVILDEFQRFRDLLDPDSGEAGELAHALFLQKQTKVLLLSATPYKPFTHADEDGEDHYSDFIATIRFLSDGHEDAVAAALARYRRELTAGGDAAAAARDARSALLPYMTRSERPPLGQNEDLVKVVPLGSADPTPEDIRDWVALHRFGDTVDAAVSLEHWKSIPYFANFMDGYLQEVRIRSAREQREAGEDADTAATEVALRATRSLDPHALRRFDPIDLGHGHLRALAERTVGAGWWAMLWMPPSMPYLIPGEIYDRLGSEVTKHVVFSAWSGVPKSLAGLLSYEADRLIADDRSYWKENSQEGREAVTKNRLQYRLVDGEKPGAMSTLSLFWPHPQLASIGDPLRAARQAGRQISADELLESVESAQETSGETEHASDAFFAYPGSLPDELLAQTPDEIVDELQHSDDDGTHPAIGARGFALHVQEAHATASESAAKRDDIVSHPDLARLAAFAPGVSALGAIRSVAGEGTTEAGQWRAAFVVAEGLRALFNRPGSMALLDTLYRTGKTQWQKVLAYCEDGNLRAVLDEYVFQLHSELGGRELDDESLLFLAEQLAGAVGIRRATYRAHETTLDREQIQLSSRFALQYGGANQSDAGQAMRQGEVRQAFNSPFAPFVLASTSVGQEGIDFHWWCHSVVHWNLPSNPVDFEQREGRVNRFAGHAVRKNVAERHWDDVLASSGRRAWRTAFEAAEKAETGLGEFSPWWVYPGSARIHRVIATFPMSQDIAKYRRLTTALTLYRLTLGQPRQEDMVELLERRGLKTDRLPTIDLSPPAGKS
ncbi:helicase-related protein [Dietzia sp. NPDC055877]